MIPPCLTHSIVRYVSRVKWSNTVKGVAPFPIPPCSSYWYTLDFYILLFLFIVHHHHHNVMPLARISLTLSRYFSLSFITSGRSSGLHPISSHSCCMYVRAGRPAFARPYVGVHRSTSLMFLQQCLVRLTWIVFVVGGRWPFSWCLVGCSGRQT